MNAFFHRWGQLIATFLVVAAVGYYLADDNTNQRANSVAGCERSNVIRKVLHDFADTAAANRRALAKHSTGKERQTNLAASREYARYVVLLERAASDAPLRPGSAQVDCEEAFS